MAGKQSGNVAKREDQKQREEKTAEEKRIEAKRLRVTSFDALLLNFREYCRRAWRLLKYAMAMAAVCALIIVLAGVVVSGFMGSHNAVNAFFSSIATATGTAYPVNIDSEGVHATISEEIDEGTEEADGTGAGQENDSDELQKDMANNSVKTTSGEGKAVEQQESKEGTAEMRADDVDFNIVLFFICALEVVLIGFVVTTLSGAFAGVFLKPINCIKSAPVMVVRRREYKEGEYEWVLSARIWVALPHGQYLYNGSVSANILFDDRYIQSTFTMGADDMRYHIDRQEFTMLNGVWCMDIPLNAHVHGEDGTVTEVFHRLMKPDGKDGASGNPGIQILVQGRTPSGEIVSHVKTYYSVDILPGYDFAPYHWKEQQKLAESLNGTFEEPTRGKLRDYGGFFKVVEKREDLAVLNVDKHAKKWDEMCGTDSLSSVLRKKRSLMLSRFCKDPMAWDPVEYWRHPARAFENLKTINKLDMLTGHGHANKALEKGVESSGSD